MVVNFMIRTSKNDITYTLLLFLPSLLSSMLYFSFLFLYYILDNFFIFTLQFTNSHLNWLLFHALNFLSQILFFISKISSSLLLSSYLFNNILQVFHFSPLNIFSTFFLWHFYKNLRIYSLYLSEFNWLLCFLFICTLFSPIIYNFIFSLTLCNLFENWVFNVHYWSEITIN